MIILAKLQPHILPEGAGARVYVYDNIKDGSPRDADQLALRFGPLEVQASQHGAFGVGLIVLDKGTFYPGYRLIACRIKAFFKKAPFIVEYARLNNQNAG
jgi:hypothetical protein